MSADTKGYEPPAVEEIETDGPVSTAPGSSQIT